MAPQFGRLGKIALVIAGVGYPFLAHRMIVDDRTTLFNVALMVAPIALFGLWLMLRPGNRGVGAVALLIASAAVAMVVSGVGQGVELACGVPHAIAYMSLLWFFGRTLLPGHEPVITRLARTVHGHLPDYITEYTRHVTAAWCVFFAGQIVLSGLLYAFASLAAWSLFVNVLNGPLVVLMFVGEYLWRLYRYPRFQHSSLMEVIRVFARRKTVPAPPSSQP
jgi:uncharacterized membrane protein